ncbi:MAG: ATP-binding cassette domain-containing protein [Mycobacteriales bacterium]
MSTRTGRPRVLVPETIQTSGMDCGPAALHSLLAGFGLPVSYGRLREACQTDVDGTSINALESSARALGLDVAQLMLPADHVGLAGATALPAIAVARLPSGMPHFVVAWRRHGRWLQLMDPATGRRIVGGRGLAELLYIHEQPVPIEAWEAFMAAPTFQHALHERLRALSLRERDAVTLIARATAAGPRAMACLDGQARALAAGNRPGRAAARLSLDRAVHDPDQAIATLPAQAWFARPLDDRTQVLLRGAVLVRARGLAPKPPDPADLTPDLAAALAEPAPRPARSLLAAARAAGRVAIAPLLLAIALLAAGTVAEATFLQGSLINGDARTALLLVAGLALFLTVVETVTAAAGLGIGRRLEIGLRHALAVKLPRLPDRYLRSRPPSDLAGRAHALHQLRALPLLATQLLAASLETVFVAIALAVLDPSGAPLVALATVGALGAAAAVQLPLRERELRAQEHASALGQTTLDAVLGVLAIRAHGAERAIEAEQGMRLHGWIAAARAAVRARTTATLVQTAIGIGLAIPVVIAGLGHLEGAPERLLLVLWAITIPVAAERVGQIALQWPQLRTLALRLAEPLDAPEAVGTDVPTTPAASREPTTAGAEVVFDAVSVSATGREMLGPTTVRIAPGEHVGLVGLSGAGKSTLLALALGLNDPSEGEVRIDGRPLAGGGAHAVWPQVAWVDPQVRVWNSGLAENIAPLADPSRVLALVQAAELDDVAARVGAEHLGADGGLLSGGEAQRVRLARALGRDGVRLAVLDEPLRGLDRSQRHRLLASARTRWRTATLLCATHDVGEALCFDRVLVLADGRVVADGSPEVLLGQPDSPLQAMLDAEQALREELDSGHGWRRLRVAGGTLTEQQADPKTPEAHSEAAEEGAPMAAAPTTLAREEASQQPPADAQAPTAGRAGPAFAVFATATILRYLTFAASWSVIGTAIFTGGGGLTAWALLLGATIPLAALAEAAEGRTAIALGARLRSQTLDGAIALDPSWVRREGPGRILGRSMEVDAIARLAAGGGLGAVTLVIELGVAAVALAVTAPGRAAAVPLAAVLLLAGIATVIAVRRRRAWTTARLTQTDDLLEAIAGQRTRLIQGDHGTEERARRLADYARLGEAADRPFVALAGTLPRAALAGGLAGIAVIGDLSRPADVALALGGVLLASQALRRLAVAVETLSSAVLGHRALEPLLQAGELATRRHSTDPADSRSEAVRGPPKSTLPTRAAPLGDAAPAAPAGALRVRGLCVDRGARRVLRDIDFELLPGDRAVLAGDAGAGKSTLATALAGILSATEGRVSLDGADSTQSGWRDRVGIVPQHGDNHVLLAPVAFNLLMGRRWPPDQDDLEEATAVCVDLGLGPVLERMPAGLGQTVGETGWRLSQGERARLCVARALLADHDVLILDEPLGALDPQTARRVLEVARRRARTLVVISQE